MHEQNWKAPFDEELSRAQGRHQHAVVEAHDAFKQAVAQVEAARNLKYMIAEAAWEELKSRPDDPAYEEVREAYERAKEPANIHPARRALAEAVRQADEEYKDAVSVIASKHNVTVR